MKTLLLFPPTVYPPTPYPSIFYIKGFLKRHGYRDVRCVDLNLGLYEYIYSHQDDISSRLKRRLDRSSVSLDPLWGQRKEALEAALGARGNIDRALHYFRRNEIKSEVLSVSQKHIQTLNAALDAYGALGPIDYPEGDGRYSSDSVMECVGSDRFPYRDFYDFEFTKLARRNPPEFVGISLVFEQQLLHAFAAARWAKRFFPRAFICLGGTAITKIIQAPTFQAKTRKNIFRFVDAVVMHEAEHSIVELMEYVEGRRRTFPNYVSIMFPKREVEAKRPSQHSDLFAPDYDDLKFDRYSNVTFRGGRVKQFPLLASRGCHWRKCRFCASHYIYRGYRRCDDLDSLISLIARYQKKFRFTFARFNDEAVTPELIRSISKKIIERRMRIKWTSNMRIDPTIDEDTCRLFYRAGCRKLLLGAESGSQAVVDAMMKGINVLDVERVLPLLSRAGLAPHLYIMCFYPGERLSDIRKTYDFLKRNKRYIDGMSLTPFDGEMLSPIYGLLGSDEIELPDPSYDFFPMFYLKRKPTKGMREICSKMRGLRWDLIRKRYKAQ